MNLRYRTASSLSEEDWEMVRDHLLEEGLDPNNPDHIDKGVDWLNAEIEDAAERIGENR
jgi:hypothetical protein